LWGDIIEDRLFEVDEKIDVLLNDSLSIWFTQEREPFEVRLYANKYAAKYFKRRPLPTQYIHSEESDGTLEFSVKITHEMELLPIIKYWMPHIHVLAPQSMIDMIISDMDEWKGFSEKLVKEIK